MIYKEYDDVQSVFPHMGSIYANLLELQKNAFVWERSQLAEDCFGTLTWPPFHCSGTPIWSSWSHVKTLYNGISVLAFTLASRRRTILVLQRNSEMNQSMEKWIRKSCSFISLHSKYPWVSYGNIRGKHLLIDCFIHFTTSQTSWTLTW